MKTEIDSYAKLFDMVGPGVCMTKSEGLEILNRKVTYKELYRSQTGPEENGIYKVSSGPWDKVVNQAYSILSDAEVQSAMNAMLKPQPIEWFNLETFAKGGTATTPPISKLIHDAFSTGFVIGKQPNACLVIPKNKLSLAIERAMS